MIKAGIRRKRFYYHFIGIIMRWANITILFCQSNLNSSGLIPTYLQMFLLSISLSSKFFIGDPLRALALAPEFPLFINCFGVSLRVVVPCGGNRDNKVKSLDTSLIVEVVIVTGMGSGELKDT